METGQVRTGDDEADTFVKMLQQVARITESIASGIASEYPNVAALVKAFDKHGPLALENLAVSRHTILDRLRTKLVQKGHNRNGTRSDARLGPATSKRLHSVFTERNPNAMDI